MIHVVSAVIIRKGRILLSQRQSTKDFPFAWECPGGKVESWESHLEALAREVNEELGVRVSEVLPAPALLCSREFHNDVKREARRHINLHFYRAEIIGSPVVTADVMGVGWFSAPEMESLQLAPANTWALDLLANLVRESA